jgi:arylsulfatase A-like enzyme/Tfp pilus assembly protein PilF
MAATAIAWMSSGRAWSWLRPGRPNVILITIDTLRADHVGSYGDRDARTPALDALARGGTRFAEAIAHAPLTLPSHASILTGLTPAHHGVRNNPDSMLPASLPTLAERFHAAGYETAAFVSGFPLNRRFGLLRGFDTYDDRFPRGNATSIAPYTERRADATVAAVREWFERRRRDESARPFLLWAHFFDPHRPYDPPDPFRSTFANRPYDGEIAFVDQQIAALLEIAGDPSATHTIVAIAGDHGEGLDEHGEPTHGLFIYDSTIEVPLIFTGPGISSARVVSQFVRLVDVTPTLLDLAGVAPIERIDGRSLRPLLAPHAENGSPPAPAYVESLFGLLCCGWAPLYGWREGSWMYIDAPAPELYDVVADPSQRENVAATHPAEVGRFQQAVRALARAAVAGTPPSTNAETARRLASIGYFAGHAATTPSLRDPKDMAGLAVRMESAIARERSEPVAAAADLRSVVDADPSNSLARRHLAIALSTSGRYDDAIREIETLQRSGDASLETIILLGECQRLAGRVDEAVATLRQAVQRDSENADVHDALGRALVSAQARDAARIEFERALAIQPNDAEALEALADIAVERGDLVEARMRLTSLHLRDADDDRVSVKLGAVLARSGDVPSAIAMFESVLNRAPADVDALVNLAAAFAKGGNPAKAVGYFERAVAAGAASPVVLNGLAAAKLETGDRIGAAAALRQSLHARPDQPDLRGLLRQVERDLAATKRTGS